jgi:hypothetical protein
MERVFKVFVLLSEKQGLDHLDQRVWHFLHRKSASQFPSLKLSHDHVKVTISQRSQLEPSEPDSGFRAPHQLSQTRIDFRF